MSVVNTGCALPALTLPNGRERKPGGDTSLSPSEEQRCHHALAGSPHIDATNMSRIAVDAPVTPDEYSCQYCAQVYYTVKNLQSYQYCHFVITKDLELCLAVVRRRFQQEYDIAPPITFASDHIALDIPDDGTMTDNGWEIVPLQKPHIRKDRVDNFSSEKSWVPECVLLLKWCQRDKPPVPLEYKVRLLGTGDENDFFRINYNPPDHPAVQGVTSLPPLLPPQPHSGKPDVATLCHELASVSDWHKLVLNLGVQDYQLDHMRSRSAEGHDRWKQESLSLWLRHTPSASWKDVVRALQQMGEDTVAEKIELKYIVGPANYPAVQGVTSLPPHFPPQPPSAHQELSKAAVFARENRQAIETRFAVFQTKVCEKLIKNGVDEHVVQLFVTNQFPPGDCIPPPPAGLREIFKAITRHGLWDYFNYSPLVRIVQTFGAGDPEMEDLVKMYKKDLISYQVLATLDDYVEAGLDITDPPPAKRAKYDPHHHSVEWVEIDHTLQYLADVWEMFSSHYLLPDSPPTTLLDHIRMTLEGKITEEPEPTQQKIPPSEGLLRPDFGCIRGVEVVGVTEFTVTTQGGCFEWEGYGLKLHVPEGSLPAGIREAMVNIRASVSGQFQLPEDSDLLSPVFWISPPCKSTKPVTLEVQHCALIQDEAVLSNLSIVSAQDSQRDLPYKFKQLDGGVFSKHSSYGSIQLSHFCGIAVAGKTSTPRSYCLHLYHTIKQIYDWRFYLAITQDHPALNSAVKHYYSHFAKFDTWLKVGFEGNEITLDVPEDGTIQEQQGWKITPRSTPVISRNDVDEFKEGQWIPECELMLVWKGINKTPIRLEYKLVMEGAKGRDYLHLVLDPAEGAAFGSREISAASRKPELKDLTDVLYHQVADQWKILGIQLGISHGSLKSIELKYQQDPHNCLLEVLEMWLQQVDPPPTWAAIINAVEFMGKKQLGRQLRHKCYD